MFVVVFGGLHIETASTRTVKLCLLVCVCPAIPKALVRRMKVGSSPRVLCMGSSPLALDTLDGLPFGLKMSANVI